ncbi:hypothetical protein ACHAWC_009536 [Mediolabrus comicus]
MMNVIGTDDNHNALSGVDVIREQQLTKERSKAIYFQGRSDAYENQVNTLEYRIFEQQEILANLHHKYDEVLQKYESLQQEYDEKVTRLRKELDDMGDTLLEAVGEEKDKVRELEKKIEDIKQFGQLCACITCSHNEATWMFYPCGHIAFCDFCKANFLEDKYPGSDPNQIKTFNLPCSSCRKACTKFMRVYFA